MLYISHICINVHLLTWKFWPFWSFSTFKTALNFAGHWCDNMVSQLGEVYPIKPTGSSYLLSETVNGWKSLNFCCVVYSIWCWEMSEGRSIHSGHPVNSSFNATIFMWFSCVIHPFYSCLPGRTLRGKAFYNVRGKVYCEEDYLVRCFIITSVHLCIWNNTELDYASSLFITFKRLMQSRPSKPLLNVASCQYRMKVLQGYCTNTYHSAYRVCERSVARNVHLSLWETQHATSLNSRKCDQQTLVISHWLNCSNTVITDSKMSSIWHWCWLPRH